jgi:multiple antibiotic resistance protein
MDTAILLKKIVILFTLIDPIGLLPLFIAACSSATKEAKNKFAMSLCITVFVALTISAVAGSQLLLFFGVSIGSMQVGGGIIAFIFSMGMVMGQEKEMKQTNDEKIAASNKMQLVPLGIPLMAGPAALSFVMSNTQIGSISSLTETALAISIVSFLAWVVLFLGMKIQSIIRPEILTLIEKLFGFLLAMLSVEMIVAGIKALFKLGIN